MKERLKNWITTCLSIPILAFGLFMLYEKAECWLNKTTCDFSVTEVLSVLTLGYAFLVAKDTLLEGLTLGLFKKK